MLESVSLRPTASGGGCTAGSSLPEVRPGTRVSRRRLPREVLAGLGLEPAEIDALYAERAGARDAGPGQPQAGGAVAV